MTSREEFRALIGRVRGNGSFPDEPLLAVYDALAAPALGWTKDKPTVEGLWWHREIGEDDYPEIVEIEDRLHGLVVMYIGMDGSDELSKIDGEWAGPIIPPLEVPT